MATWSDLLPSSARTSSQARPSLTLFYFLSGAFILALVPQVMQLPAWVTLIVIAAMGCRCVMEARRLPLPSGAFCFLVALCLLVGVYLQYHTILGRDPGMAFVAGVLAVKFYESRGPRDLALIVFACFFVVMSALLYSQALELFIYSLVMMWVLTALLMRIQIGDKPEDRLVHMLRRSGFIFLQALPLTVFLFLFFPRYPGKLQLPLTDAGIGFTDTVAPGSISELSRDDRKAMYVKFLSDNAPAPDAMYWRALVLWDYRHGIWTRGTVADKTITDPAVAQYTKPIIQQITIFPHFRRWIFALDCPIKKAEGVGWCDLYNGDVIQLNGVNNELDRMERYTVSSAQLAPQALSAPERNDSIQLPGENDSDHIDPKVVALAKDLRKKNPDDQAYADSVLRYFRQNHFVYSLSPGAENRNGDWLSTFLFEKKKGFCEHFASAFAVLMRLGNVPARLVVGYQGAQFNPYDNNYIVRQSNAHAWDEIWIDDPPAKGSQPGDVKLGRWHRVDPTAILPLNPDGSSSSSNSQPGQNGTDSNVGADGHSHDSTFSDWIEHTMVDMQLRRQQLEAGWDDWVFSYDASKQTQLADFLGFGRNPYFLLCLACLLAGAICAAIFRILMRNRQVLPPVENLYATFCRSMAQSGVPRAMWEGPLAYTERVAGTFPEREPAIRSVGVIVARARYGPAPVETATTKELESLLKLITMSQTPSSR